MVGAASGRAYAIFGQNYVNQGRANTPGSDKYFHCMANCESTKEGFEQCAIDLSNLRENANQSTGRGPQDSLEDQTENAAGRNGARNNPSATCRAICGPFRPDPDHPDYRGRTTRYEAGYPNAKPTFDLEIGY